MTKKKKDGWFFSKSLLDEIHQIDIEDEEIAEETEQNQKSNTEATIGYTFFTEENRSLQRSKVESPNPPEESTYIDKKQAVSAESLVVYQSLKSETGKELVDSSLTNKKLEVLLAIDRSTGDKPLGQRRVDRHVVAQANVNNESSDAKQTTAHVVEPTSSVEASLDTATRQKRRNKHEQEIFSLTEQNGKLVYRKK
ncbi:hypothetical protein [Candidatus Enterococcus mangumiae]|uniref:Uncharacterized protein n=1 Tax=Candidatus Enterococcus mangumiae TaxID=2230878 RepID=A0ABZ2SW73_9ENTE|nr:hypothetical protein [Enterococcus sp. DIV1094]MBO0489703.1 hypothetical protein [Enterococcus sp. DIV1094]